MRHWLFLLALALGFSIFSCRLQDGSEASWLSRFDFFSVKKLPTQHPELSYAAVNAREKSLLQDSFTDFPMARLAKTSCTPSQDPRAFYQLKWQLHFDSVVGATELSLSHRIPSLNNQFEVDIDNRRFIIRIPTQLQEKQLAELCSSFDRHPHLAELNKGDAGTQLLIEFFRAILSALAPDCRFDLEKGSGWYCHLDGLDAHLAEEETRELKNTIIRRWSRLPYILTRRLLMTHSLSQLYSSEEPIDIESFCRIIEHSLDEELPLVFTSQPWRQAVCNPLDEQRQQQAIRVGLNKAVAEIELLRQLYDRTSRLGLLSLRIPKDLEAPGREFWLSLIPQSDVSQSLAKSSATIWLESVRTLSENFEGDLSTGCWHPLFRNAPAKLLLAKQLDLVGSAPSVICTDVSVEHQSEAIDPHLYLAESVTSETEFALHNGRSILLRLPIGTYDVQVKQYLPASDEWEDSGILLGSSQALWQSQRPNVTISQLQLVNSTDTARTDEP